MVRLIAMYWGKQMLSQPLRSSCVALAPAVHLHVLRQGVSGQHKPTGVIPFAEVGTCELQQSLHSILSTQGLAP